ncbi:MAG: fibronectin type III domain-containing protein [Chloroflexi bacterium]|nr:fibronectin type III domain-containing protein [Chloroflexota bacterium]
MKQLETLLLPATFSVPRVSVWKGLTLAVLAASTFLALAQPVYAQQQKQDPPGAVLDITLTATTNSVTVSWQPPQDGGDPKRYIVQIRANDGGKAKTKTPKAKKTSVTFDGLDAGKTYKVWVRAKNNSGKGERVHATVTLPQNDAAPQSEARPVEIITYQACLNGAYAHLGVTCP